MLPPWPHGATKSSPSFVGNVHMQGVVFESRWLLRAYPIRSAAVIMAAAFALSAGLGVVRQILLGATFGDGVEVAAYYAAARLPETLINLVAGGALVAALVPLLVELPQRAEQQRLLNVVTSVTMVGVALATVVGLLATGWFVRVVLMPEADVALQAHTITLTRVLLFQPLLLALASIIGALLTVERRFALIALAYVSHNITILLGIGAAWYWPWIGIYGPTVGLLLAAVLKAAIVWLGLHWLNGTMRWQWDLHHPMLKRALWLAAPTALSVTVNYAGSIVDTSFATRIGVTTVAAIYSAWLLADMPARLIGSAIGQAAFPQLAQAIADGDLIVARRTFVRVAVVAVVLTLPIIVLLLWAGRAGIAFVLERGAFDQAAGDRTFAVLQWYILGLPAFVLTELSSRMLNAMHDTHTPLATNVTQLTAKWAVLNGWGLGWGVVAVPIAHVMTCYGETALLLTMVWRRLRQLRNECKKTPK